MGTRSICVDVDTREVLDEMPDEDLLAELKKRGSDSLMLAARIKGFSAAGLADDLRTAFYARNASRFEALLAVFDNGSAAINGSGVVAEMPRRPS